MKTWSLPFANTCHGVPGVESWCSCWPRTCLANY